MQSERDREPYSQFMRRNHTSERHTKLCAVGEKNLHRLAGACHQLSVNIVYTSNGIEKVCIKV